METAVAVVNDLVNAGFHRNSISLIANDADQKYASQVTQGGGSQGSGMDDTAKGAGVGAAIGGLGGLLLGLGALAIPGIGPVIAAGPLAAALAGAGIGAVTGGMIGALVDLGVPEESAHVYAESVRRGNALVAAQVEDNRVNEAARIMEREGLIDVDTESDTWRSSGWSRFDDNGTYTSTATEQRRMPVTDTGRSSSRAMTDDDTIEVVEEDIQVGKRAVETGGVRVRSYVREVPVEEQVHLRQEHVEIERRPVDRPATTADLNNFREGTIEVRETQEQAVVGKEARVVEEIRVRKEVEDRTETIRDTVRHTEVEVEQLGQGSTSGMGSTAFSNYDTDFRNHFQTTYTTRGGTFDRYQPAYQYGYTLATDDRYRGRSWSEVEPEARRAWDSQNQNSWEDFKDAVQYSWDKVRGRR